MKTTTCFALLFGAALLIAPSAEAGCGHGGGYGGGYGYRPQYQPMYFAPAPQYMHWPTAYGHPGGCQSEHEVVPVGFRRIPPGFDMFNDNAWPGGPLPLEIRININNIIGNGNSIHNGN
jgi:hypothetical protein